MRTRRLALRTVVSFGLVRFLLGERREFVSDVCFGCLGPSTINPCRPEGGVRPAWIGQCVIPTHVFWGGVASWPAYPALIYWSGNPHHWGLSASARRNRTSNRTRTCCSRPALPTLQTPPWILRIQNLVYGSFEELHHSNRSPDVFSADTEIAA